MSGPPLLKSLPELVERGFIGQEQADRIRAHYTPSDTQRTDRSLLLFSLLGGLLIGTGIVLLVAHNWDQLPRIVRTLLAFLPMLICQALCMYVLLKKNDSAAWREGTALALSFMVAAAMSLVAQIHHIADDINGFYLAWAVLIIGVVYVMRSFSTALLYIAIITVYGVNMRWGSSGDPRPYLYLPLFAAVLPFFLRHLQERPAGVSTFWLSFFVAVSFAFGSQLFWHDFGPWQSIGTAALALVYMLIPALFPENMRLSPFRAIGAYALIFLIYALSSRWGAVDTNGYGNPAGDDIVTLGVMVLSGGLIYAATLRKRSWRTDPLPELFFVHAVLVVLGPMAPEIARLLANLVLLGVGVVLVRQGIAAGSLGRMNLGLLVLAAVIVSRFFDFDSFMVKGVLSITIGLAFLLLNLRMVRARKARGDA